MPKYLVGISWDFSVDAADPEDAKEQVRRVLDAMLPGDGWLFGETINASDMIDYAKTDPEAS